MNLIKSFIRYTFNRTLYPFFRRAFKFIVSFFSIFIILISSLFTSALTNTRVYQSTLTQPNVSSNSGYAEVEIDNNRCIIVYFACVPSSSDKIQYPFISGTSEYLDISLNPGYPSGEGTLMPYYSNLNGTYQTSLDYVDEAYYRLTIPNNGRITGIHVYGAYSSYQVNTSSSFTITYGGDSVMNDKLDQIISILSGLQNGGGGYDQPDPGISSGIAEVEQGEQAIVSGAQGSYDAAVSSGTDSILGFFNSAGQSLLFVKTMFNNLVSSRIFIVVTASIMLAILPVLLGVFRGISK